MSLKRVAVSLSFLSALAVPAVASAQEPKKDCEPGSWFCGETNTNPPAPAKNPSNLEPLPSEKPAPAAAPPPPVVVYQPPPPTVVVQTREAPAPYYYVPKKAVPRKEWGLNLHVGGAMLGKGRDDNAGMGLAGIGLRYRPIPHFAMEGALDFAAGRDYNGYRRNETAFAMNAMIFVNPKSITQFYLLGGIGFSHANATDDRSGFDRAEYDYSYLGIQAGAGLEFRLSRTIALNIDLRGLIRGRVDNDAGMRRNPEFTSADGKTTNTSGAGLITGGLTFYW